MHLHAQPIGSLLRPEYLKRARRDLEAGQISAPEYKRFEDRAVREAVAIQEEAGLAIVTDGEQRRISYLSSPYEVLVGWQATADAMPTEWYTPEGETVAMRDSVVATSRLERRRSAFVEEATFLRATTDRALKVTVPSPMGMLYAWHPELSRDAYPDPFALFADVAGFLREDVEDLVALGCDDIQVDAPEFTALVDERRRREFETAGIDPERLVTEGVAAINSVFADLPGLRVGMHLCRGNWDGNHMAEGGYDRIAKQVFQEATVVDEFFLEYDDARSGGFEPLVDVPRDKHVYLGLVSTKSDRLEDVGQLLNRIEEAAAYFPRERLGVCTQCGFASGWDGNPITPATQRQKLQIVTEVARRAWPA